MKNLRTPELCLDQLRHINEQQFDIRIAADGRWFHEGDEIHRIEMVKLFASVLLRDDYGDYWLATPFEKGRIIVDDVPFIICELLLTASADPCSNNIHFRTNLDEVVALDGAHPIMVYSAKDGQDPRPYIEVRNGLLAKLSRPVYYQLAEHAEKGPDGQLGVWSYKQFFSLEL